MKRKLSPDDKHRVFLGSFVSEEIRNATRDFKRNMGSEVRNFHFPELEKLHVTFQFLSNELTNEQVLQVTKALNEAKSELSKVEIEIDGLTFGFPSQKTPSIIFWNIKNTPELNIFTRKLHLIIQKLGFYNVKRQKDRNKLIHHITIARTKRPTSHSFTKKIRSILPVKTNYHMKITGISLIKSILTSSDGTKYEELGRIELETRNS